MDAMTTAILQSSDEAASAADTLIQGSSPFSLEPLPDDEWRLDYRPELRRHLEARLGRELLPVKRTGKDKPHCLDLDADDPGFLRFIE